MRLLSGDWEEVAGEQLRQALPAIPVPAQVQERIRRRLQQAQGARAAAAGTGAAAVLPLPMRSRPRRRLRRWVAAAAAALLLLAGGPQLGSLPRRWFGPRTGFPLAAPLLLADTAEAASPAVPGLMQHDAAVTFTLAAPLPDLPRQGQIERAETPSDPGWLEQVKTRLGIAEPVTRESEKGPALTARPGYWAGRLSLAPSGAWAYQPAGPRVVAAAAAPSPEPPPGPAIADAEAVQIATDWLRQAGLYPAGPVAVRVDRAPQRADEAVVEVTPAPGSPLAAVGGLPQVQVRLRSRTVWTASGLWPTRTVPAGEVPLRTAQAAWADLQAGVGAVVATGDPGAVYPAHPELTITSVTLDRALVRSLDDRWYYIPVVLFQGEMKDVQGQGHRALAYVSAVQPAPGQGGFELHASLPAAPAALPLLRLPDQAGRLPQTWTAGQAIPTFTVPTPEHVRQAALRVAAAAGADPAVLGTPELYWSPGEVVAVVPALQSGLPLLQTMGDPQWLPAVTVHFSLTGAIRHVSVQAVTTQPAGDPLPLLSPAEAWRQAQAGAGLVKVIGDGRTFPTAQWAAHRTSIDRVDLAYNVDTAAWTQGRPAEPTYFFWGKAVVGEDFSERSVLVMVPAVRR